MGIACWKALLTVRDDSMELKCPPVAWPTMLPFQRCPWGSFCALQSGWRGHPSAGDELKQTDPGPGNGDGLWSLREMLLGGLWLMFLGTICQLQPKNVGLRVDAKVSSSSCLLATERGGASETKTKWERPEFPISGLPGCWNHPCSWSQECIWSAPLRKKTLASLWKMGIVLPTPGPIPNLQSVLPCCWLGHWEGQWDLETCLQCVSTGHPTPPPPIISFWNILRLQGEAAVARPPDVTFWMLLGTVLKLQESWKLHSPWFWLSLDDVCPRALGAHKDHSYLGKFGKGHTAKRGSGNTCGLKQMHF